MSAEPISLAAKYFARGNELLTAAWEANAPALGRLAPVLGASIASGGVVHTFGSGHSELVAREIIGRAGGLVCVNGIIDPTAGFVENLVGFGTKLVERYDRQYKMLPGEIAVVISNSGKNSAPIEVALHAKKRGLTVVAMSCLAMSKVTPSQHPSGQRLFETADFVLDNGGITGDAIVDLGNGVMAGPTSTLIGCSVLNWMILGATEWLRENGHEPPVLRSQNLPGAIEHNRALAQKYHGRLSRQLA